MRNFIFSGFFLLCSLLLGAQNNYSEAIEQGDAALRNGQYKIAINKYFAAEAFDASQKEPVKAKVNAVFDRIEALRKEAEMAKSQAQAALLRTTEEQKKTKSALAEAEKARNEALTERDRVISLNEFIKYNNNQIFESIKVSNASLVSLKETEYFLATKYLADSLNSDYYLYSLYNLSSYYEQNRELNTSLIYADKLCRLFPHASLSYERRSIVNYYLGNWEDALLDVDNALRKNPDDVGYAVTSWNKSLILTNLGRYEEANAWADSAIQKRKLDEQDNVWGDAYLTEEISSETGIYSLYFSRDYSVKSLEKYKLINDLYAGKASIDDLINLKNEKLSISILLILINYSSIHINSIPNDYIVYLTNGYLWELGGYTEQAEKNYKSFLAIDRNLKNEKYGLYKNAFESPIYKKLKIKK
ncbi:MAG: hypothetical protein ABIQ93_15285 [Saprospiraceae bacterium]